MQISRRAFLSLAAAGLVAGAAPSVAGTVPGRFGFTFDEYLYETGFASREDAVTAARATRPGHAFVTAEVESHPFHLPDDLGEKAVDHLINTHSLSSDIVDWFACANEEGDFEGELADACHRADRRQVEASVRASIADALWRAGDAERGSAFAAGQAIQGEIQDGVLDAVASDGVLAAEMESALRAFADANRLPDEIRGLLVEGAEPHAAEPSLAA